MVFLPHTNTVILLELYCGTITEPGLPVAKQSRTTTLTCKAYLVVNHPEIALTLEKCLIQGKNHCLPYLN